MRLIRERLEELMISLEYDEFDEEDINEIIEIHQYLQDDSNNVSHNHKNNIEYFNKNILVFCQDGNNTSKIIAKITNENLKEKFRKVFKITDNTNNNDSNILVINSKEEGDIQIPNRTIVKDKINNIQVNIKKTDITHQNVVDNDIEYLNDNPSIEPIIKEENESFNSSKNKSNKLKNDLNTNFNNSDIPPTIIKETRSQITSIIRNTDDNIKKKKLKEMYNGIPEQKRKMFIKKILSIGSMIGDINKHIMILESTLHINIKNKAQNVQTKVQLTGNKTNNIQPLNNTQSINDASVYLQQFKSLINDNQQITLIQYYTIMKDLINNTNIHQIPFELYYYLYVIHLLCTHKSSISYIKKFDQLYYRLANIEIDYFPQLQEYTCNEDNSSLKYRKKILSLIDNRIKNKKIITFDKYLFSLMVNELDKGSMDFNIQTIRLYLYSIELYKEYESNNDILQSIEEQIKHNINLIEVYYYYSFLSLSKYNEDLLNSFDSDEVLLDMFIYDWKYNHNRLFSNYSQNEIKALSRNDDINVQFCLSVCNQGVDQKKQYRIHISQYNIKHESITVKAGVLLLSIINQFKENTIEVNKLINTIKKYYQNNFDKVLNFLTIDVKNPSTLSNCRYYSFIHSNLIQHFDDNEITYLINDENIQFIFIIPKNNNNEGSIYQRIQNNMWWDYLLNQQKIDEIIKIYIKFSLVKYKGKVDIYIIYKVFHIQRFFEQYKNRLNGIKDIWYSIMLELLLRYPIQCINYQDNIIQYLKGCIHLPNAKDEIRENLNTLIKDLPSYYYSFKGYIQSLSNL